MGKLERMLAKGRTSTIYQDSAKTKEETIANALKAGVPLKGVDLSGANLSGVSFIKNDVFGADLTGCRLNWNCHELLGEVLRQAANDELRKLQWSGFVAQSQDWCWPKYLDVARAEKDPLLDWVLDTLRPWIQEGDVNVPEVFKDDLARVSRSGGLADGQSEASPALPG